MIKSTNTTVFFPPFLYIIMHIMNYCLVSNSLKTMAAYLLADSYLRVLIIESVAAQMCCRFSTASLDKCIFLAAGWYRCNWLPCSHPTAVNNAYAADKTRGVRKTSPSSSAHFPIPAPHNRNSTPSRWWWLLQRAVMQACTTFSPCWPACLPVCPFVLAGGEGP